MAKPKEQAQKYTWANAFDIAEDENKDDSELSDPEFTTLSKSVGSK